MSKTNVTLYLNLLAVFISLNSIDSKIIYPARVNQEDVDSLLPLQPKEALPLILFKGEGKTPYQFPMGLAQVEIKDGRLASGTEFYTIPPSEQIFFCPNPGFEPTKMALFEANYGESRVLQCEHEPQPIIIPANENKLCGPIGIGGALLEFAYSVTFRNKRTVDIKSFPIYKLCYSYAMKIVKFVEYKAVSANLLSEKLVAREREIEFEEDLNSQHYDQIDPNYRERLYKKIEEFPNYGFQKLLPPEYMALYSWRKSAYHYANVALQHKNLINLWSEIHTHINKNAMEMHQLPRTILTGLSTIPSRELPIKQENQINNIWVTLIMDKNIESNLKGLAILMHNFIMEKPDDDLSSSASSRNQLYYIDKICGPDLCVNSLKQKSDAVEGQLRCCKVTEDITKIFFWTMEDYNKPINQILEIHGITYDD